MDETAAVPTAKSPEGDPQGQGRVSLAGIAAALAIAGAVWYGIQSLVAAWVYDPLGVLPREIGLSSSALLTQATIGLAAFLVLVLVALTILLFVLLARGLVADLFDLTIVLSLVALAATFLWLFVAASLLGYFAWEARSSLKKGERPGFVLGFPAPWRGEVAFPSAVGDLGLTLPTCALYLGQADGTVVLYDVAQERALRIPASAVTVNLDHDLKRCPS